MYYFLFYVGPSSKKIFVSMSINVISMVDIGI